jgi:hypothetical protein
VCNIVLQHALVVPADVLEVAPVDASRHQQFQWNKEQLEHIASGQIVARATSPLYMHREISGHELRRMFFKLGAVHA